MEPRKVWRSVVKEAVWIILVSSLIGFTVNLSFVIDVLRGERAVSPEQKIDSILNNSDVTPVTLPEAKRAFDSNSALFVDSRSAKDYAEGHILGSINLPWEDFEELKADLEALIQEDRTIITYCGGSCDSSAELAEALRAHGFTHVKVLLDGWPLWVKAQYPVDAFE
ncbi:MAG: rhodanese-like domain-containing protein [Gemmatimonadota bacterium]|nr:MAG: rhodanese-like domain-containing protein [Gemmatimonadota bacterium]